MELWDAYNINREKLGVDLVRGEKIPDGHFHLVVAAVVHHTDGDYLITKRNPNKKPYPGFFECSAGGSAIKGEDDLTGVIRELKEETGLSPDKITKAFEAINEERHALYSYFNVEVSCSKDSIILQPGETEGYEWISKDKLLELMQEGKIVNPEFVKKTI